MVEICCLTSHIFQIGKPKSSKTIVNKDDYAVNDHVLIYRDVIFRKLGGTFLGPYKIIEVYTNVTLHIQRGIVTERINICRLTPYTAEE